MIRPSFSVLALSVLAPLTLAGCGAAGDPYAREGTWHATGVNDANLRVMLVDPGDLAQGRGADNYLAAEAAPPIHRLFTDARYPLPTESASGIVANTGGVQQPAAAAPAAGGSNGQN